MLYNLNIDGCLKESLGKDGISGAELDGMLEKVSGIVGGIKDEGLAIFEVPSVLDDEKDILAVAGEIRKNFDRLIVLGTGGSTLNPQKKPAQQLYQHPS